MSAVRPTHPSPLASTYRARGDWRPETLWRAFGDTTARRPGRTALVDGTRRMPFEELAMHAERVAGALGRLGVAAGDVVAVQLPNWWETAVVLLAAARLGAVANPVLPIARERELGFVLGASGARIVFIPGALRDCDHRRLLAALRPALPALAHVVTVRADPEGDMLAFESLVGSDPPASPAPTDATAVALLMYTSGTTADPKGVLHSHETLLAEARSLGPVHAITADDVVLMPSPLTHISGLLHAVVLPAVHGTGAVLMERWDAGAALALVARERVTYMVGAPTFLRDLAQHPRLAEHDVSSLRLFSCGGADVDPTLVREAAARLGCVAKRVYGSTEFPTVSTTGPDDPPERRIDSEGRPIGSTEVRLVDEDDRPLAAGSEGEILARGPELCLGYQDPALNADAFTVDGWFRTGDLGTLDAEGYLRVTGRKKDIIIRKGENISAREIEDLLASHPAVAEVAVIGIPDPAAGEIACAVVRMRPNASNPTLAQLCQHLLARGLSKRKLPERLELMDDFPRTASGKVVKRTLRDRLRS